MSCTSEPVSVDPVDEVRRRVSFFEKQVKECQECIIPCRICPLGFSISYFSRQLNDLKLRLVFYEGLSHDPLSVSSTGVDI